MSNRFHIPGEQTVRLATAARLDAVAEATKLPRVFSEGVRLEATPQGSAVSWAFWQARKHDLDIDQTIALVALAHHAAAATYSGDGYLHTTPQQLAEFTGWPVEGVLKVLETPTNAVWSLVDTVYNGDASEALGWRIPNDALDGNWLDRASRQAHYGATQPREEEEPPTTL